MSLLIVQELQVLFNNLHKSDDNSALFLNTEEKNQVEITMDTKSGVYKTNLTGYIGFCTCKITKGVISML